MIWVFIMDLKVSVIIPVHNVETYLQECLDSVINQTLREIEIICINDGSTDNSLDILVENEKKDSRIHIINQNNFGIGISRNNGLSLAKGEFIYFLDSDDFLEVNALEMLYNNAKSNNSDCVIYKFNRYDQFSKSKSLSMSFNFDNIFDNVDFNNFTFDFHDVKRYVMNDSFAPWTKLYKKEFLDSYDDFYFLKDVMYEDVPFHVQVMLRAKLSFCPMYLYNYRISNDDSETNRIFDDNHVLDIFKIIDTVEDFIRSNNFYDEFKTEFNFFKFTQIFRYLIRFPSEKYFLKAKSELYYLNVDFSMNFIEQVVYNTLLNSESFYEFYVQVFGNLFAKMHELNGNVIQKNNILSEKDAEIRRISDVIVSKDSVIGEKDAEIRRISDVIVSKNGRIDNLLNIISTKNDVLFENKTKIREKSNQITSLNNEISNKRSEITYLENKFSDEHNLVESLKLKNQNYESEVTSLRKEVQNQKDLFSSLNDDYGELNKKLLDVNEKNQLLENEIFELKSVNSKLLNTQNDILSSKSWKITEPMRNVVGRVKK